MHIGNRVKEVLAGQGHNARWLASQLPCERSNVYNLFKRASVGVDLLMRLSVVLGHDFFVSHTEEFYDFYRERMICLSARPNQAHVKLAELEQEGSLAAVVTQNIYGLHQAAGSRVVHELHGSVHRNVCLRCGATYSAEWVLASEGGPHCEKCGGLVKPDVVLYGEQLDERVFLASVKAIAAADLLVIGGTSLVVYPAAGLINYFSGNDIVVVNRDPTPADTSADLVCACDIAAAFDF